MLDQIDKTSGKPKHTSVPEFASVWSAIDQIPGYLIPGQERWLYNAVRQLPDDAVIVEVGSFLGRSTAAMAFACCGTNRRIHAIDTFAGNDSDFVKGKNNISWDGDDFFSTFKDNLAANDLLQYIVPYRGLSHEVGANWSLPIDFIFIDGSHDYEDVLRDFETYLPWVKLNGIISFHDVLPNWVGPFKAWTEQIRHRLDQPAHFFSIAYGRKRLDVGRKRLDVSRLEPKVHVIVPVHNRKSKTRSCLRNLLSQSFIDRMTITVVDDGSADGTGQMLADEFPDILVIKGDGNLWWTGAVAKALDELKPKFGASDFFLLVNNDAILSVESVEILVRDSELNNRAGVSPIALRNNEAISTGWGRYSSFVLNNFERQYATMAQNHNLFEVSVLFGRCSLFPVEILDETGNFDANEFPHYFGDTDFCTRAARKKLRFFITGATCIRVSEAADSTGTHFNFRQGPQKFSDVRANMFSIKSIDNIGSTWRYMQRHHPERAIINTLSIAWRSLRQWVPIYNTFGLKPIPEPGSVDTPAPRKPHGFLVRKTKGFLMLVLNRVLPLGYRVGRYVDRRLHGQGRTKVKSQPGTTVPSDNGD